MDVAEELKNGDVFLCIRTLKTLLAKPQEASATEIDAIGSMLSKYSTQSHIPIEYAELLLLTVNKLMEAMAGGPQVDVLASSPTFVQSLYGIIYWYSSQHHKAVFPSKKIDIVESSFVSHYCYELTLYMLLGLIESSHLVMMTMKSITKMQIIDLFKSLSAVMGADTLYLTQEMALEVICRVVHFILSHNSSVMEEVLKALPEALQEQLSEGASSISSTLLDMRPYLNALNERNPSITSARFTSMEWTDLLSNVKKGKASQIKESGWLDICGDVMCLQTMSTHSFVRFEYSLLGGCRVSKSSGSLEVIITGGVEKLLSVVQFTSRGSKTASSHAGKLSIKMAVADELESLEQKLASQIKASKKEHESEQRDEMAKYSVVSNKTNVVSDRSNAGQEVSSISSPDFAKKEEGLHTGQNKAWRRFADEKIKDSLLQIQDDRNNPKSFGGKKRKAAGSGKSETKPPQDKRMRTERTREKPEPKSAVKSTTKSSASKRSPRANMSSSRVNVSDWNDDNEQGGERRVEEEEMYNYEDQLNTSYFPEPLHPLDDPELLPAHPLPHSSFVLPPPPQLEFETGSKASSEREGVKQVPYSAKRKTSTSSVLKESTKPPLYPNRAVKPIGKENEMNTLKEQRVKSSKTNAKAISDSSVQAEESREKARGSRMRFASNKENEEDQVRVVASWKKETYTVPETPAESQPYTSYPFKPPSSAEPSEDEDVEMNLAGAGGQISLNDSSSNEEASVLTNIINEILMMQQERLQRKRMKLVTTLCEETEKQLKLFINQWIEYCFDTCTDSYHPLLGNLAEVEKNSQELDMHNRILAERDKLQDDMRKLRSHYLSQAKSLVSVSAKGVQQPVKEQMLKAFGGICAENQKIVNEGASFATLTSVHVADLYSRVSGLPPLTWQDSANLPGVDLLASDKIVRPQIVEIVGDVLPNEIQEIARTRSNNIPALEEVVSVLRDNGVEGVVTKRFEASSNKLGEVKDYLSSQSGPVLVLHTAQMLPSASRRLQVNGVPELDERQISQYQICLWVGVVFVLLGIFSICGIANMDVEPDSLLYAKFQSARTDGKRD
eukprot:gene27610-33343_t